jgi:transcriptional regulator with GAF, ATPase, and Fis domain
LVSFLVLAVVPIVITGVLVAVQLDRLWLEADRTSRTYELRAEEIAAKVSNFLHECELNLKELAKLPRNNEVYSTFAAKHRREVWVRTIKDGQVAEARQKVPLYREVSFIDKTGLEKVVIVRGQPLAANKHRKVVNPKETTYKNEEYFTRAIKLGAGQIYVSHLNGFHVNKIEQLGVEDIIHRLKRKEPEDVKLFRYLLYETLRVAGELEYVDAFMEEGRSILVYRVPGTKTRIFVDAPPRITPQELQVRQLELQDLISKLAPEDVVEGKRYDGVIRFAMPVADAQGKIEGVVSIALDHIHLMQFTQHVKAMEEDATVFAGYRDADYTYLFDDQGWIITHPKLWNIRGVDHTGRQVPAYSKETSKSEVLVGRSPVHLMGLDWKMGEGYHALVLETQAGRTGIATSKNLGGVLRTRVYSPIFYSTGPYAKHGIFGGVMMGTRVDKFIEFMREISIQVAGKTAQVRATIVWILLYVLVAIIILSIVFARGLVRPIRILNLAARQIGAGDLSVAVPLERSDEIGELAGSFLEMTTSLRQTFEELEQKNLELKKAQQKILASEKEKRAKLQTEVAELLEEVKQASFANIVANSPQMKKVLEEVVRVSKSLATVLILGENGTGKELIAEAIHRNSPRKKMEFLRVNCAAFNDNLLESELFGHKKGSFTGAVSDHKGLFEVADGGTLLLDEVGDMSLEMQKRLLRALQEGEIQPVGSNSVVNVDVRIIAATNKDLMQLIKEGMFREDLYHRINVISIAIPPLRERKEDILPLAHLFLKHFADKERKASLSIDPEAGKFLQQYQWTGNVRELENAVERAVIRSRSSVLKIEDFQLVVKEQEPLDVFKDHMRPITLAEMERIFILKVLEKNEGNKKMTAEELGIGYNTLWRKLKLFQNGNK